MKKALLLILVLNCFYKTTLLYGQCITAGPNNGNLFSGNTLPGDQSWANSGSAKLSDGSYATSGFVLTLLSVAPTKFLKASDFQFNIPSNAIVKGIQVDIQRLSGGINLLAKIQDNSVRIMKGGVFVGQDKASNNYWPIFNSAYETYGGPNDMWGTTWTPADINSPGFGAAISAELVGLLMLLPNADIDHIRITVNYSIIPTLTSNMSTICAGTSATLTASGSNSYSWTPFPGFSGGTSSTVVVNPSVTTTYTLTGSIGTCNNTNTITINVNPAPVVIINSLTGSNSICQGDSLGLSAGTAGSYTWSPATGLSSVNSLSVNASPSVSTTYSLFATASNGCDNTLNPATFMVNVNAAPVINLNATANTICSGGNTVLDATGANTYTWSPATGLSSVNGASVTASPTVTTVYQVTGSSSIGCGALSVSHVTVTVNNTPVLLLASNSPANTICLGNSTALNASGASSYTWSPSTGLNTTTGANVIANPTTTTIYTVNTTVSGGCSGSASSGTLAITVNNGPTLTPSTATSTLICQGTNAMLSVNGATSYTWSPPIGLNTVAGANVIATPSATTIYTVLGTAVNGCDNAYSPTVFTVSINSSPVINLNSTAANYVVCQGTSATLTATGANTYSWSPPLGLNTTTGPTVIACPSVTTVYTIQATGPNGCTNAINPLTVTLTVNSVPTVSLTSGTTSYSICNGSNIPLSASGANSYTWSPAASLNTAIGANVIAHPMATTIYTVIGQSANGCSNALNPQTVTVTVHPTPMISLSTNMSGDTLCLGQSVNISVSGSAMTYTWNNGMTGQNITVSPITSTVYDVITTNTYSCSASGSVYVVVIDPEALNLTLLNYYVTTPVNTPVTSNVSIGALPNTPSQITITQNASHGSATISNGVIVYMPANNYDGADTVHYAMCDMYCNTVCTSAKLVITIESDIHVPGVLSPNGDGTHDQFYIKGLSKYTDPELVIFNRWGNVVFSAKPYNNDWHGQSSGGSMKLSGSEVLDGTYYYLLTLEDGVKPIKGFFELKRK
ncbi:MAG: gliding motility-associated C-terminal domain-containing protein [Bacteroidota bacterium]